MKKLLLLIGITAPLAAAVYADAGDESPQAVISGDAGVGVVQAATGEAQFGIPAVLYFDDKGCLRWSSFGLANDDWEQGLDTALASAAGQACGTPQLLAVLDQLESDRVVFERADLIDQPVVIWYGNDDLCRPCAEKTRTHWPVIRSKLPEETKAFVLTFR